MKSPVCAGFFVDQFSLSDRVNMQTRQLYIFIGGPLDGQALNIPKEQETVDVQDENKSFRRIQYKKRIIKVQNKSFTVFAIADASEQQIEKVTERWSAYFQ